MAAENRASDPAAAPPCPSERASEAHLDTEQPQPRPLDARFRAECEVRTTTAAFDITGNHVFAWEAIEAALSPPLGADPIPLPDVIRTYLHDAAHRIVRAAISPPDGFPSAVVAALQLSSGTRGDSVPRDYAKRQSASTLLGIHRVLRLRHGTAIKAEEIMRKVLGGEPSQMQQRLTEARAFLNDWAKACGLALQLHSSLQV